MDSSALHDIGFGSWLPFTRTTEREVIEMMPASPGVYVILFPAPEQRRVGVSDIGYIGKATNVGGLRARIRQYFHPGPTQSTNLAMKQRLDAGNCPLRIGLIPANSIAEARRLESDLLLRFEREHGQLPPYNKQRALDLMSRIASRAGDG